MIFFFLLWLSSYRFASDVVTTVTTCRCHALMPRRGSEGIKYVRCRRPCKVGPFCGLHRTWDRQEGSETQSTGTRKAPQTTSRVV